MKRNGLPGEPDINKRRISPEITAITMIGSKIITPYSHIVLSVYEWFVQKELYNAKIRCPIF
jgi:hypothetical protein